MEKLYYKNSYIKEFNADIIEKTIIEEKVCVVLSKTAFFPGGGGQFFDVGFIEDVEVIETFEKDEKVYHKVERDLHKYKNLSCKIDWDKRFDGMVQHLAQHVLSGCFFKLLGRNTVSFHLGQEVSTVDIKGVLTSDELLEIEKMANYVISQNLKVNIYTPSENELSSFNLRRDLPNSDEDIRIVEIENLDINACCGVHPSSTLELKFIKFRKSEKNRGNTRVEYLAGNRAINYTLERDVYLNEVSRTLKCMDLEAVSFIENNFKKIDELKLKIKNLEESLVNYEVINLMNNFEAYQNKKLIIFDTDCIRNNSINNDTLSNNFSKIKDINFVKKVSQKITENDDFLFIGKVSKNIIVASSKNTDFDSNKILKNIIKENGRGGGNKNLAQGFLEKDITKENILESI